MATYKAVMTPGRPGWRGGLVDERIGYGLYHSCGNRDVCLCFGCGAVGGVGGGSGLGDWTRVWGGVEWCYVCVSCESGLSV